MRLFNRSTDLKSDKAQRPPKLFIPPKFIMTFLQVFLFAKNALEAKYPYSHLDIKITWRCGKDMRIYMFSGAAFSPPYTFFQFDAAGGYMGEPVNNAQELINAIEADMAKPITA